MVTSRSVPRLVTALLCLLSLLLCAFSLAQDPPRVVLDEGSFVVGEPVGLRASRLQPEGDYLVAVDGPGEEGFEDTVAADADGELSFRFEPTVAGEWTVRLAGEDLSSTITLSITDAEGAAVPGDPQPAQQDGDAPVGDQEEGTPSPADEPTAGQPAPEGDEAPAEELPRQPAAAEPAQPASTVGVTVDGDAVVGTRDGRRVWRFDFPAGSGGTGALLELDDVVWLGHGNSALAVDKETGVALRRHPMPGRVVRLEPSGEAVSVVSDVDGSLRQRIEIDEDGPRSVVRFGTDVEVFGWLRREAQVPDPVERLRRDPTNPWLHLAAGLSTAAGPERLAGLREAVARARTFYDLAGIARELLEQDEPELARQAMDLALRDFAERGYDPQLLTSPVMHRAYDLPLAPMEEALANGDLTAAGFWAPWLYLMSNEEVPAVRSALTEYAGQLETVGQRDAASLWRERAQAGRGGSPAASLDRFFLGLGRSGWYAVAALLASIVALHLTLIAKYWAPQSLAMRRAKETSGSRRPWARLFAIRYYSFTEKLVLVLLFAASLTLLGLTGWYDAAGDRPLALSSGTLSSPAARDVVLSSPLRGQRAGFIRGYAAQVAGEEDTARDEYLAAGDYPPALNNLAALSGDDVLYRRALELAPGLPEASFNLGRATDPSPFHAAYQTGQPLLAVPGSADFRTSISGTWQRAVSGTFMNPWRALREISFFGLPGVLWQILLALFLLWGLVTLVWLLVPRPALARNAPRPGLYHLLALLIPGSGLADEAWGVLLMVPWALLGVDALAQWLGWERSLGLALETEAWALAGIYGINLIAFVVEFISYQRRMRALRRRNPEAVEAFGIRGA
jgi:hypothetical protein